MIMIYGDGFANGTSSQDWKAKLGSSMVDIDIVQ
jgi:hypothetical protein